MTFRKRRCVKCGKYYERLKHRNNARYGFCSGCFENIWKAVESGEYEKLEG